MAEGTSIATAYVSLVPSMAGMKAAIAKELDGAVADPLKKQAREAGRKSGAVAGGEFASAMKKATAGITIAAVGLFAKDAIAAASDLGESLSKTGVIFGDTSQQIRAFADTAAASLGLSKRAALDAASTFATFGKSAGLTGNDLAQFSTQLTSLSADLASFYNSSPEQAITAIGAALRGESEPIRQFGVLLDDATLRQRAFALGLIDTTKNALTPQQKALAAQAEIMAQTSDAQGDFARTSEGLANQQRIMAAEFENARAALGEGLLPVATQIVGVINDLLGVFNDIPAPVRDIALKVGALALAFKYLRPRVDEALTSVRALMASEGGLGGFAGAKGKGIVKGALAVAAAIAAIGVANAVTGDGEGSTLSRTGEQIDEVREAVGLLVDPGLLNRANNAFSSLADGVSHIFGSDVTTNLEIARDALSGLDTELAGLVAGGSLDEARSQFARLLREVEGAGFTFGDLMQFLPKYSSELGKASQGNSAFARTVDYLARYLHPVPDAMDDAAAATKRWDAALRQMQVSARAVQQELADYKFEASLNGLDDVTAATLRAARASEEYDRVRRNAGRYGTDPGSSPEDLAKWAEKTQQAWLDWQKANIDVETARSAAARQAAEDARAAAEQLQQARQSVAETLGGPFIGDLIRDSADGIGAALKDLTDKVRAATSGAVGDGVAAAIARSNAQLQQAATERDAIVRRLEEAQSRLSDLLSARANLVNQVRSQSFGSLISVADQASAEVDGRTPTASQARATIVAQLNERVQEIRRFGAALKKLAARGLPQYLLNEIIQAGPDAGLATAELLASSPDTEFNKIKSAAQSLYQESRAVAQQAGKVMYDAGIQSAKGLVEGLKAQERAIQAQMIRIANMMVATIRRALGIRSPSTVFADLGANIGAGLAQGILGTAEDVRAATDALVAVPRRSAIPQPTAVGAQASVAQTRTFVVENLTVNYPAPEPASTGVAGGLRRTAFMLGAHQ